MCLKAYECWDTHPDFGTFIVLAQSPGHALDMFKGMVETHGKPGVRRKPGLDRRALEYSGYSAISIGPTP